MQIVEVRECQVNEKLLKQKIDEVSFALDDTLLYLDTHPEDEKALKYYEELVIKRRELMKEYAKIYGPLTIEDARWSSKGIWAWSKQPFPWEKEGGCK